MWFARLHSDDVSAQDHMSLVDWLAVCAEHREAYAFVTETCRLAAYTETLPAQFPAQRPNRVAPLRWLQDSARNATVRRAIAASLVAGLVIAGAAVLLQGKASVRHYQTAVGEIRNVTLEDGTNLVLNGATKLDVAFDRRSRAISMERGELYITVGKDPARPLRLSAGDRVIEDVGTAFDVNMHAHAVDVSVGEGAVTIFREGAQNAADTATLLKGQALTFALDHPLGALRNVGDQRVATWRVGVLTYDQVPLEWLVADLNRQFDGDITVTDPALAAMSVTLTLKLRDRNATIDTLEKLLPIQAVPHSSGVVELIRAKS